MKFRQDKGGVKYRNDRGDPNAHRIGPPRHTNRFPSEQQEIELLLEPNIPRGFVSS